MNAYTTKTIAHRDDILRVAPATPAVTWAELDAVLDVVPEHPQEVLPAMPSGRSARRPHAPHLARLDSDVRHGLDAARLHPAGNLDFDPVTDTY